MPVLQFALDMILTLCALTKDHLSGHDEYKRKVKHTGTLIMLQKIACHIRWICFFLLLHYPLYGLTSMLLVAAQCGQTFLKSFLCALTSQKIFLTEGVGNQKLMLE